MLMIFFMIANGGEDGDSAKKIDGGFEEFVNPFVFIWAIIDDIANMHKKMRPSFPNKLHDFASHFWIFLGVAYNAKRKRVIINNCSLKSKHA